MRVETWYFNSVAARVSIYYLSNFLLRAPSSNNARIAFRLNLKAERKHLFLLGEETHINE